MKDLLPSEGFIVTSIFHSDGDIMFPENVVELKRVVDRSLTYIETLDLDTGLPNSDDVDNVEDTNVYWVVVDGDYEDWEIKDTELIEKLEDKYTNALINSLT